MKKKMAPITRCIVVSELERSTPARRRKPADRIAGFVYTEFKRIAGVLR
jgi:hypothetical protein